MKTRHFFAAGIVAMAILAQTAQSVWLEDAKIVRHIPTRQKVIALTFDDGPHPKTTPEILKILKEKQIHATFFVLGENGAQYPQLVAEIARDGHLVGTHAYTHRHLKKLDRAACAKELDDADRVIRQSAAAPHFFRPPGGLYDDMVLEEAKKRGYTTVLWSIDPTDWKRPSAEYVVETVLKKAAAGGIILLHDGMYPLPTPKAVRQIIDRLRGEGYTFVTVEELLRCEEVKETGEF